MAKMYDMILLDQKVKELLIDIIERNLAPQDYQFAGIMMTSDKQEFDNMIDDCIKQYYHDAVMCRDKTPELVQTERYILDLFIRAWVFEHYNVTLLGKVDPKTEGQIDDIGKKSSEPNDVKAKSDGKDDKRQNLRDLGMTDEEIEDWFSHDCESCKKHDNFNDKLNCMRRVNKAAEKAQNAGSFVEFIDAMLDGIGILSKDDKPAEADKKDNDPIGSFSDIFKRFAND